jgi:glycosyltransferase involved in cell wall biosynthesis
VISFIVPAHNEQDALVGTLESIEQAARAGSFEYEIWVVDDASTDRTAIIAREHGVRLLQVDHRQIAATRNSGARASRGDRLIFVDADTQVNPEVIAAAMRAMDAGAVGGGCSIRFDEPVPLYGRLLLPLMCRLYRAAGLAAGCFVYCTRDAFERSGGFDERLYGAEEVRLSRDLRRLGRFRVLRETVLTSGRKMRAHSPWQLTKVGLLIVMHGTRGIRKRETMSIWYDKRRADPKYSARRDD